MGILPLASARIGFYLILLLYIALSLNLDWCLYQKLQHIPLSLRLKACSTGQYFSGKKCFHTKNKFMQNEDVPILELMNNLSESFMCICSKNSIKIFTDNMLFKNIWYSHSPICISVFLQCSIHNTLQRTIETIFY